MFSQEILAEERRIQRSSAIITGILTIVMLSGSFVWWAWRQRNLPPPGEEWEVVGAIDFGNLKSGSRKVNNFEEPTETPKNAPPKPAKVEPRKSQPAPAKPTPQPVIKQEAPSPIITPKETPAKKPEPKPKPQVTPSPKPAKETPTEQPQTEPVKAEPKKPSRKPLTDDFGGSNQGDKDDGVGNQGTPDVKILDPNGLYSFGSGVGGGRSQRAPLSLSPPKYTAQEEGQLKFEFVVRPNGSVAYVKCITPTSKLGIKRAGEEAIRRWRFTALKSNQSQQNQRLTVTITFKLKG